MIRKPSRIISLLLCRFSRIIYLGKRDNKLVINASTLFTRRNLKNIGRRQNKMVSEQSSRLREWWTWGCCVLSTGRSISVTSCMSSNVPARRTKTSPTRISAPPVERKCKPNSRSKTRESLTPPMISLLLSSHSSTTWLFLQWLPRKEKGKITEKL